MSFGTLLEQQIEVAGYPSLRAFALEHDFSREAIRAYVKDERNPSNEVLERIGVALKIRGTGAYADLVKALTTAREKGAGPTQRSYGIKATNKLKKVIRKTTNDPRTEDLLNLFFEHTERDREPEFEHFLRDEINNILGRQR